MYRSVALVILALSVSACGWFAPEAQTIEMQEQFAVRDQVMVHYVFEPAETDPREDLARCLTQRGVVLYGSRYCGPCQRQRDLFGPHVRLLNYVDCADTQQRQRCIDVGIRGVPMWIFQDGRRRGGVQTLRQLARYSGCRY